MSRISRFLFSLRSGQLQRDVHDEVDFHIEMKARELATSGVPEREARARALRQFGNVAAIEQTTRDVDRLPTLDSLGRDLRFSLRSLRKSPTFTAVAVVTIALGIGANLAVFGIVEALLLRPLPYPDSKNLVIIGTRNSKGQFDWASYADLADWRAQSATLEHISAYTGQSVNLTGERQPERLNGAFVSDDFLTLLGVKAARGRIFQRGDDHPGSAPVVVASYRLWQARYGGAEDFVGRKLVLNGAPFTVAGVLPADFKFAWSDSDIWIPFVYYPNYRPDRRSDLNAVAFAHIRVGHTMEEAQAELTTIAGRLASQYPDTNRERGAVARPYHEFVVTDFHSPLLLLWGAVGMVFLIACANLANLALSRILSRQHELRVRMALGAGRATLLFQLALENLLLASAGFALALILGAAALNWIGQDSFDMFPTTARFALNAPTVAYGIALAIFSALLCSSFAATQIWKRRKSIAPETNRGLTESHERGVTRRALVIAEFALSIVLLAGAGLLIKSYARLSSVDPGFRPQSLLTAEYRVPRNKYPTPEQQWALHWEVVQKLRQIPGVRSASAILSMPFSGNGLSGVIVLPDRPTPARGSEPKALINRPAPGALETLGVTLDRGRYLDERDHAKAAKVALVSRTFAQRFWPDQDPIGRLVKLPEADNAVFTIVGVVGDVRQWQLDEAPRPQMYVPFAQMPHIFSTVMIQTTGDPASFAGALRQAVWSVDKDQPVWKVRTLESMTNGFLTVRAFLPRVLGGFAAFALLLAAVGIYGVIAYSTARRIREFGLRVAIGAQPRDVLWLVLSDGMRMTLAGVAVGGVAAAVLCRVLKEQLRGQLFRVESTDPSTFAGVVALLALVSLAACYIPARRALRVDPVTALRHE
jgi:putative ABC transport system permease protein